MKVKSLIICVLTLLTFALQSQINHYQFRRALKGTKNAWNQIILPDSMFEKVRSDLKDIRVMGVTGSNDSIEIPFLLDIEDAEFQKKAIPFNLINESITGLGFYLTFEAPKMNAINEISMDFKQVNFDWRVNLEGSQDNKTWSNILTDARLLSIRNHVTQFKFTKLVFPETKYRYYRLLFKTKQKPELASSKVIFNEVVKGESKTYRPLSVQTLNLGELKQTVIDINLPNMVPVNGIELFTSDKHDYYRPLIIKYLSDSSKTTKGYTYTYETLNESVLSSIEKRKYLFPSTLIKRLKITIENQDNQPLAFDSVHVQGILHKLVAKFNNDEAYYLVYGKKRARRAKYDKDLFEGKVPTYLSTCAVGGEEMLLPEPYQSAFFKYKIWLWLIVCAALIITARVVLKKNK